MYRSMLKLAKNCRDCRRGPQAGVVIGVVFLSVGFSRPVTSQGIPNELRSPPSLMLQAYEAGKDASRQFFGPTASDPPADGQPGEAAGAVSSSRSTVLWASGVLAAAVVVAAFLLRPKESCRVPLTIDFPQGWWKHVTDARASNAPPPPPPPIVMPALPEGCHYG